MKISLRTLLIATTVGLVFASCTSEEDDIFGKTAAERLNEASDIYSQHLMASPNGWAMQYYPTYSDETPGGQGFLILFGFAKDHSVKVSLGYWPYYRYEYDATSQRWNYNLYYSSELIEDTSLWEVITDNGPVLSFNSYNRALHLFSDPDTNPTGTGIGGDYEFIIVDAPDDASYMMLKGKKHGTYNLLTPVEVGVDYSTYLAEVKAFQNKMFAEDAPTGALVHFGDSIYRMDDANDGLPNIYPYDGDPITNESFHPYLITKRGEDYYLRFRDAFERSDMDGVLQELRYDVAQDKFIGTDNEKFTIEGYDPQQFFGEYLMTTSAYKWTFEVTNEMSDSFKALMERLSNGIAILKESDSKKRTYTLTGLQFNYDQELESYIWSITYKAGTSTGTLRYKYNYDVHEGSSTFTYVEPAAVNAQNSLANIDGVQAVVDILNGEFVISAGSTRFNLSTLKVTSKNDPNLWFVVKK